MSLANQYRGIKVWRHALSRPEFQSVVYPKPEVVLITSHDHCLRQGLLTSWGRQHDPDVPAIIIWHNKAHCGIMNQALHLSLPLFSPPAFDPCLLLKHRHSVFDLPLLPFLLIPLFISQTLPLHHFCLSHSTFQPFVIFVSSLSLTFLSSSYPFPFFPIFILSTLLYIFPPLISSFPIFLSSLYCFSVIH